LRVQNLVLIELLGLRRQWIRPIRILSNISLIFIIFRQGISAYFNNNNPLVFLSIFFTVSHIASNLTTATPSISTPLGVLEKSSAEFISLVLSCICKIVCSIFDKQSKIKLLSSIYHFFIYTFLQMLIHIWMLPYQINFSSK